MTQVAKEVLHQVFVDAFALIDKPSKWGKGMRGSSPNANRPINTCCVAEAIEEVVGGAVMFETRKAAFEIIKANIPPAFNPIHKIGLIVEWNDAPERTYEDVVALFQKCIKDTK